MEGKERIPLIIDTDPGVDDFFALLLAASSKKYDLKGITAVAGNCPLALAGNNALSIAERFDIDVPVYLGVERPIVGPQQTAAYMHGEDGLCGLCWKPEHKEAEELHAWEAIIEEAKKSEKKLVILALGPLTNLAIAFCMEPKLMDWIDRIVFMGGSTEFGNITPYAEFNIYADPTAAEIVLRTGVPLYMVGLNVTSAYLFQEDDFAFSSCKNELLKETGQYLAVQMKQRYKEYGYQGIMLHDVLAAAAAMDENCLAFRRYHVAIERKSGLNYGRTVVDTEHINEPGEPNCFVAVSADRELVCKYLQEALKQY